jgi:hypothetical protein
VSAVYVDIENRSDGPPLRVWVNTKNPRTAIRTALEQNPGTGLATIQGKPWIVGRAFASGLITVTVEKRSASHGSTPEGSSPEGSSATGDQ